MKIHQSTYLFIQSIHTRARAHTHTHVHTHTFTRCVLTSNKDPCGRDQTNVALPRPPGSFFLHPLSSSLLHSSPSLRFGLAVQWSWFARVNALCNFSRKKSREVTASLPGRFLSRRCFTLCLTVEVEPSIAKQYKCHHCCSCKNYWGKGMERGKKWLCVVLFFVFVFCWPEDRKKIVLGHPIARATSYCLLSDTFWLRASKNVFKVGSVKFANSLSPPSIVKKVPTGSKSSQGT